MDELNVTLAYRGSAQGTVVIDLRPIIPQIARLVAEYLRSGEVGPAMVVHVMPGETGDGNTPRTPTPEEVERLCFALASGGEGTLICRRILWALCESPQMAMTRRELREMFGPRWGSSLSSVGKAAVRVGLKVERGPFLVRNLYDISDDEQVWSITNPVVRDTIQRLVVQGVWL